MAFAQRPVPEVPDYARASTEALREWLDPLVWHTWREDFWPQTYAFVAWKGLIFIVASALLLVIIKRGEFWLVRKVTGPRGPMLVVKATDAPLMSAAIFVGVDAVYRGLCIHWWKSPNFHYHKNELVWEAMRLFPAWLTAHIHLCSSCLVWPLPAHRVHPWLWHAFLLGVPLAFFTTLLPPVILSSNHCAKTYHLWEPLQASLLASPGRVPTAQQIEMARSVHAEAAISAYYLAIWALVGALFVAITLCGCAVVGWTLSRRVAKALSKMESEPLPAILSGDTVVGPAGAVNGVHSTDRRSNLSDQEAAMTNGGDESMGGTSFEVSDSQDGGPAQDATTKAGSRRSQPAHSTMRMVKYLIGVSPFRGTEPEVIRKPFTPRSARRVLRNFHFHATLESISLVALLGLIFGLVIYMMACAYETVYDNTPDATYGNGFMKVAYLYHVIEMWGVVVFGSCFALSVLYRSAFPTEVDTETVTVATNSSNGRHRRGSSTRKYGQAKSTAAPYSLHTLEGVHGGGGGAPSDTDAASSASPKRVNAVLDTAKAAVRKLPSIRRPGSSNRRTDGASSYTMGTSETQSNVALATNGPSGFAPGSFGRLSAGPALLEVHRSNLADAGSFAGMGVGRSIVLEALSAGTVTSMTQRRKAAWRTQPFSFEGSEVIEEGGTAVGLGVVGSGFERGRVGDLERSPSTSVLRSPSSRGMFATPHGLVEGIATSPSTVVNTPQTLQMSDFGSPTVYVTPSPRPTDGLWTTSHR